MHQSSNVGSAEIIARIMDSDINTTLTCSLSERYCGNQASTHIQVDVCVKGSDDNASAIGAIVSAAIKAGQLFEEDPANMRTRLDADHRPDFDGINLIRRI